MKSSQLGTLESARDMTSKAGIWIITKSRISLTSLLVSGIPAAAP